MDNQPDLLNSIGNYIQYSVTTYKIIGKGMYIHAKVKQFTIYLKLTQYYKPTIVFNKK